MSGRVSPNTQQLKLRAAALSVFVSIVLMTAKFVAWRLTGSAAVLSDAAESIINVVASIFAFATIRVSAMPPDEDHPYGHGKIEYFSAGFEGALIVFAALGILWAAIPGLIEPPELQRIGLGIWITVGAAAVNCLTGLWLIRVGKREKSSALEADGLHLITDVVTSAGVVVGLLLVKFTGIAILDPILAVVLALNILVQGWKLVRKSAGRLMDEADEDLLERIVAALKKLRGDGDLQPHQLRATRHGPRLSIDFHIFLPRYWDLTRVHGRVDEFEDGLARELGEDLEAIIHVDPCQTRHCSRCGVTDCAIREAKLVECERWDVELIKSSGEHPDFEDQPGAGSGSAL